MGSKEAGSGKGKEKGAGRCSVAGWKITNGFGKESNL